MPKSRARAIPAIEWVGDALPGVVRLTAVGTRWLMVENLGGILTFSPDTVRLRAGNDCLVVTGENLFICQARAGALIIRGIISSISLPRGAKT